MNIKRIGKKKSVEISWYVKLNIMIMGFLFVVFIMKQIRAPSFQSGLSRLFSSPSSQKIRTIGSYTNKL